MIKAFITWFVVFVMGVILARGAARQVALQMTIPFPSYDDVAIYRQIKARVFSRTWLACNIASSSLIAIAMMSNETWMLALVFVGVSTITAVTAVQGYQLFRVALREMDLPWPPVAD